MKKLTVLLLVCALAGMLAGCRKTETAGGTVAVGEKSGRLANGDVTISMFFYGGISRWATDFSYENNTFTKKLTDDTGVKVDVTAMSYADSEQRLNVMLNAGDYPEVIFGKSFSINELSYYGSQGILIPLDDYHMENYKNIGEALSRYPLLTRMIQGADGKTTYALPRISECLHCLYRSGRTAYYMPFVRDNKLKMFETYDEFVDYLRWVRDNDANGNGDKTDEIPMMWASGQTTNAITFFARNYMPYIDGGIALVNGKVTEQYKLNEFRETLKFMANMYKEKLIAPDSFTMTTEEARALANRETPIVGAFGHQQMNAIMTTNSPRWVQSFITPTLKGKDGVMYASNFAPWQSLSNYMVITDKCKNPEIAIGLYDYLMEFETELNSGFGPRGDFWDWPDEGALGLNGLPARYKMLKSSGEIPANLVWSDSGAWGAFYNEYRYGLQGVDVEDILTWLNTADPSLLDKMVASASYNEAHNYLASNQAVPYKMPDELFIPPIGYNDEDDTRMADINVGLNSYLSQSWVEFITGARNIDRDADWNTYLREIDQLGGAEKAAIIQKYLN